MNIKITGKELKATESIKDYIERKLERLNKYFGEDFNVLATIKTEGNEQVAEMNVTTADGDTFRAVTAHKDLYASIDKDIDILEGQIRKIKTKKERMNKDASIKEKGAAKASAEVENEIIKELYYDIKPMDPEDAKMKLQEKKGDIFLPFINIATGKVSVIYKLKDSNNYGLVEPEA